MINELYQLSLAMDAAGISGVNWHRKYGPLPNVKSDAPCVRIVVSEGHIESIENLNGETAANIRKYGSNQGSFPAMNLQPLYRLHDETKKKKIADYLKGKLSDFDPDEVLSWCTESNWPDKFASKYKISTKKVPEEIGGLLAGANLSFQPIQSLIEDMKPLTNLNALREELEQVVKDMIMQGRDISLALRILFFLAKPDGKDGEKFGTLSVVFDSQELEKEGIPTISTDFTAAFNRVLLTAEEGSPNQSEIAETDAFGHPFEPINDPMPVVKLAAGFSSALRTMYEGQPCHKRYGGYGDDTFPISRELRLKLSSALDWIGQPENKGKTWLNTAKDEALFAYPARLKVSVLPLLARKTKETFESSAAGFMHELITAKIPGTEPKSEPIQIIVLRKVDKARTKIIYSYNTTPGEIETASEQWTIGCRNVPDFTFGQPAVLFPLELSDVLNRIWKQDGTEATDKFKPYPKYHGLEFFFGGEKLARRDLNLLSMNATNLAPFVGNALARYGGERKDTDREYYFFRKVHAIIAAIGLFLYHLSLRKENYMHQFPYLLGQLLKVSDNLHASYCKIVREKSQLPPQFIGSSFYIAASESPCRTMEQLAVRMNPYLAWAKSYSYKGVAEKGKESAIVGWYLSVFAQIADELAGVFEPKTRFSEAERAMLFLGYLGSLPKKEKNGGTENEE